MPVIEMVNQETVLIPRLMILRGSPGVGKSTVSSKVCAINSAKKKTYISVDAMQHMDLRAQSKNKEKLGIKNAGLLAQSFLSEGFDVVLDYVFDETEDLTTLVDSIYDGLAKTSVRFYLQMFYLDAPIERVVKRNQSRSGKRGEYMNTALLRKLYNKVELTKGTVPHEIIINTTSLSAKQTARTIISCNKALLNGIDPMDVVLPEVDVARALESDD